MPLQIRRGTTSERLSIIPSIGEPIYDTDLQIIYVGDGTTAGGISTVTTVTEDDIRETVGEMFTNGSHTNIQFLYSGPQIQNNRIDAVVDLSNYNGEISASAFRGSVIADDSSLFFNALTKNISVNDVEAIEVNTSVLNSEEIFSDTINGELTGTSTVNLNSTNNEPINITFAGNTIDTNRITIKKSRGTLETPLPLQDLDGVGSYRFLAYDGNDYTPAGALISSIDGSVAAGNFYTDLTFTIREGATENIRLRLSRSKGLLVLENNTSSANLLTLNSAHNVASASNSNKLLMVRSRGTTITPLPVQSGDFLFDILFAGRGSTATSASSLIRATVGAAPSGNVVPGNINFLTVNTSGTLTTRMQITHDDKVITNNIESTSLTSSSFIKFPIYNTAGDRDLALPVPEEGMVVFNRNNDVPADPKFQGFNGTIWVDLNV